MKSESPYSLDDFKSHLKQDNPLLENQEVDDLSMIFSQSENFEYPDSNVQYNWNKLQSQLNFDPALKLTISKKPQFHMFKWLSAAVVLLMISFGLWQYLKPEASFIQHYASHDKTLNILLEDGTSIKLNKNSTLYVLALNQSERVVKLKDGEAFFHVKHNNTSFVVQTSQGNVIVKGTKFNVKDRKSIPLSISLQEGLVNYETANQFVEILPGETIVVEKETTHIIKKQSENMFSWLEGELKFSNQTLADILKELSALHKVNFKYDSNLASEKITITFQNLSAKQSVELLSKTLNSPIEIE
jgi:transmembrane sensor